MKKKCILCKGKLFNKTYFTFNNINKKIDGEFQTCLDCKIDYKKNKININNLYFKRQTINFNVDNKFILLLKSFFLNFFFLRFIDKINNNQKILDFGTGSGELANTLFLRKYKKLFATDLANKRPLNLINNIKYYPVKKLKIKKFDIVIARHTLEHIKKIHKTILFLKKIVKKDGLLVIEIPNFDSFWKKVMKGYWPGYFYPFHEYVFSKKSFILLLKKNNLNNFIIKNTNYPIFGNFFFSIIHNLQISKIISIFLFPFQIFISSIFRTSESLMIQIQND